MGQGPGHGTTVGVRLRSQMIPATSGRIRPAARNQIPGWTEPEASDPPSGFVEPEVTPMNTRDSWASVAAISSPAPNLRERTSTAATAMAKRTAKHVSPETISQESLVAKVQQVVTCAGPNGTPEDDIGTLL